MSCRMSSYKNSAYIQTECFENTIKMCHLKSDVGKQIVNYKNSKITLQTISKHGLKIQLLVS